MQGLTCNVGCLRGNQKRDSGCNVIVGQRPGGANYDLAISHGFEPMSVADFYDKTLGRLAQLGFEVTIYAKPVELPDPIKPLRCSACFACSSSRFFS